VSASGAWTSTGGSMSNSLVQASAGGICELCSRQIGGGGRQVGIESKA
jgi:hypothetical protein